MSPRIPRSVANVLALQGGAQALCSMLVAMPLAWLVRDVTVSQPQGVRSLFADGGLLAVDLFFRSALPLSTAAQWVLLGTFVAFLVDCAFSVRLFRALRSSDADAGKGRAFVRVLGGRIVFATLAASIVALCGLLTTLLAPKFTSHSDAFRDVTAVSGYAVGLLFALPIVLFRDLWLSDTPLVLTFLERFRRAGKVLRRRFFALAGHYLLRTVLGALIAAISLLFVRAPASAVLTLVLLAISRLVVVLRVIVRNSFYIQTSRELEVQAQVEAAPR